MFEPENEAETDFLDGLQDLFRPDGLLFPAHTGAGSCFDRTRRCGSSAYFPGLGELPLAFYPDLVFDKRPGKSRAYMSVQAGFKL